MRHPAATNVAKKANVRPVRRDGVAYGWQSARAEDDLSNLREIGEQFEGSSDVETGAGLQ